MVFKSSVWTADKRLQSWLGLVCFVVLIGCGQRNRPAESAPPTKVVVAQPLNMPIVEWDQYTGRLEAIDSVEVRARVSGYLESTHFDEGQLVERGDLLAIIDPRPFQAVLNGARASLKEATARLEESRSLLRQAEAEKADSAAQLTLANRRLGRTLQLVQSNAVTREEVDIRESEQLQAAAALEAANAKIASAKAGIATSTATIETAKSDVEAAMLNFQYTQVRAPVSGRISRRYVTDGNLISGGTNQSTLLTTIVSLDPVHCYFDANESAFLKYVRLSQAGKRASSRQVKNPVFVALVDEKGFPHKGHMDFVDNRVDANTGTMRGRAILDNADGLLTPGLFVKVRLPGSGRYEATLIPDSAVGSDQSEKYVYTVLEDGTVERKSVELGPLSHGLRIVRQGLEGSEQVVIRGLQSIFPGAKVQIETTTIEAWSDDGLPEDYEPVPREKWLSRSKDVIPEGVQPNAAPYREPTSGSEPFSEKE